MREQEIIHANTAAVGQLAASASKVMQDLAQSLGRSNFYKECYGRLTKHIEETRSRVSEFLGVNRRNIALCESTSHGLSILVNGLRLSPNDAVAISQGSFVSIPATLYPMYRAGVRIIPIGNDDGSILPHQIANASDELRVVVVEWVNHWSGYRNDMDKISRSCQVLGAILVIDAVQGLGATPIDFDVAAVDALVCGGHKWLRGPEGTGFIYISDRLLETLQVHQVGYRSLADMENLEPQFVELTDTARRFEVGTVNAVGFAGLDAALQEATTAGLEGQYKKVRNHMDLLHEFIGRQNHVAVVTPVDPERRAGIISIRHQIMDSRRLRDALSQYGVIAGVRRGCVRLSPHSDVDVGSLLERIEQALRTL